ncbi:unnamed protein product, partial [Brassica oleracea var. botrytis]
MVYKRIVKEYKRSGSSSSSSSREESVTNYEEKEPCDMCGSNANDDWMMTCFNCKVAGMHIYCVKEHFKTVPDKWICEKCRTSIRVLFIKRGFAKGPNDTGNSIRLNRAYNTGRTLEASTLVMKTQRLNQKEKDSESNQQPDSNTPSDSESAKQMLLNYIFHFGTTFQATPVKTFGSRTTNEKEKPVNVGFVILGSVWFTFKKTCEICGSVSISGLMMLKKLPRYSMTHLKTTSSINQKTKDVSVDGQTHQTLISSLDQIFHGSTSPKCKSRNGSVDRSHLRRICFWIKGAVVWRLRALKLVVLPFHVSFPGGGGSYSSIAAGPCLQEVEASSAPPSSVLSSGGEGSLSLASPA